MRFLRRVPARRTWVLLIVVCLLAGFTGRYLWAEFHLRAARRALERRAYAEAQTHLDHYLHVWPRSSTANLLAARCARGAGSLDEAERILAACRQLNPDPEALLFELDLLGAQRGTLGRSGFEGLWRRVERGDPETPCILEALTQGCLYSYRLPEAMACLERWLAYSPGDSQALYLRGLVWEGMGMGALPRAAEDYRQAVRRDPEHFPARKRLAEYLLGAGQFLEAAELFQQLLERDRQDATLLLGLACCRRLEGRYAEAERLLDELLSRDSPPPAALIERARVSQQQGDDLTAEKWYRQALAKDAFDREACYGLGQCLRRLGRTVEAQGYEARADQIDRDLARLERLHEQMTKGDNDPELPCEAGMICLRNGQHAEARRWFRNVLQQNPHHQAARQGLEQSIQKQKP